MSSVAFIRRFRPKQPRHSTEYIQQNDRTALQPLARSALKTKAEEQ
jgi:hypothetical protein